MSNQVKIIFFASMKLAMGQSEINIEIPDGIEVSRLKSILVENFPQLDPSLATALVSINREFAFNQDLVPKDAEIAIFPPVSGGTEPEYPTVYIVTNKEMDLDQIVKDLTLPTTGAVVIFSGIVRGITNRDETRTTEYLEYEAYQAMAEEKMSQIAQEIRERWPAVEGITLIQRLGVLHPGAPTVTIACSAAHRDTGVFDAARYGIDRLKEIVPIWKKEVDQRGEYWIEGSYLPKKGD